RAISATNARTDTGGAASRSSSKAGRPASPSHSKSCAPGGSRVPAARSSMRLWDPRRRLPAMPRIRMRLGLFDQAEGDARPDVGREGVADGGQGGVPADAPLRAVDDGAEAEVRARVPERVDRRRRPGAGRRDGPGDALDGEVAGHGRAAVVEDLERVGGEPQLG